MILSLISWLLACDGGLTDKFATEYADKYCQALIDCESDFTCSTMTTTTTSTSTTDAFADCDYDGRAAEDCIAADWTCDADRLPVPDPKCAEVYDCP